MEKNRNIILIGFMGSGKSSIGIRLARRLKRTFVDTDREIEKVTGMSVAELFRRHGEVRFRSEEKLMMTKLINQENMVIAAGGSLTFSPENNQIYKQNGSIVICLKAPADEIFARVNRKKGSRPLLKKALTVQDVEKLMNECSDYEKMADFSVETGGKLQDQIVDEILECLKECMLYAE